MSYFRSRNQTALCRVISHQKSRLAADKTTHHTVRNLDVMRSLALLGHAKIRMNRYTSAFQSPIGHAYCYPKSLITEEFLCIGCHRSVSATESISGMLQFK